jgi:homotetrameric NADPH-dependent glutamate synthase
MLPETSTPNPTDALATFGDDVLSLYRRGVAESELAADELVARSLMPPGSAAGRDFSSLAPTLPAFLPDACTGCMACVNVCPDAALLATVLPAQQLTDAADAFFSGETADADASAVLARFTDTVKYGRQAERRGLEPAKFGLFVDATKCKGCAECVDVCPAAALRMTDKLADEGNGRSTIQNAARQMAFYRSLPPTPDAYRSDKVLADLMLGEHADGYVGGAGSCAGCGEATAIRMMIAATRQIHGPESMGIVASTGCNSVFGATYPFNPYRVPWTNSLFENAPADALGIRSRWDQEGHPDRKLWVLGGDGAMYDIGFQSLSRMVASGADVNVLVLDTQVYSNTGGQASTATFGGQVTKLSAFGKAQHGKVERRKELGRILMSHGDAYVAQVSTAHVNHFYRAVMEANEYPGPAVLIAYTPCMPEHGIADDAGARSLRAAVDSRAFPLFTYDPRRGSTIAERLSLAGNPSVESDWHRQPDGTPYDFIAFARGEGRFAAHFAPDGTPTSEMLDTQADRLANWHTLQELAGVGRAAVPADGSRRLDFAETSQTMSADEAIAAAAMCLQCKDPTCVAACPIRVDIPRYLEHVAAGDFAAAAAILFDANPMPDVTSRVCAHERQCEGSCKRATSEGTVPIGRIERFVAEWARDHGAAPAGRVTSGRRVAVVGAGPGGLACAGELARRGHAVTVYDGHDTSGGILRHGIPSYRLPPSVVEREVDRLRGLGVAFELGVRIGDEETLEQLRARYDAVFVAIGAGQPVQAGIPGEQLDGVMSAADYLEAAARDPARAPRGRSVAVLGAGNAAMDAARTALRLGAEQVTVVYRRGRREMPAIASEVHEAEIEGVRFVFLANPAQILDDGEGRVRTIRCERMVLGEPDASGRPRPVPSGEMLELEVDLVITALGSRPGPVAATGEPSLATDETGRALVSDDRATNVPGVYAGGDLVRGPATVVEAIGDGLRAAEAIDHRLAADEQPAGTSVNNWSGGAA